MLEAYPSDESIRAMHASSKDSIVQHTEMPTDIAGLCSGAACFRVPPKAPGGGKWSWCGKEFKAFDDDTLGPTLVKFETLDRMFKPETEPGLATQVGALKSTAFSQLALPRPVAGGKLFEIGDVLEFRETPMLGGPQIGHINHLLCVREVKGSGESAELIPARLRKAQRTPGVGRDLSLNLAAWQEQIDAKTPLKIAGRAQLSQFSVSRWWRERHEDAECIVHLKVGRSRAKSARTAAQQGTAIFADDLLDDADDTAAGAPAYIALPSLGGLAAAMMAVPSCGGGAELAAGGVLQQQQQHALGAALPVSALGAHRTACSSANAPHALAANLQELRRDLRPETRQGPEELRREMLAEVGQLRAEVRSLSAQIAQLTASQNTGRSQRIVGAKRPLEPAPRGTPDDCWLPVAL